MRVDDFDNTLVCEPGDLSYMVKYFKQYISIPEYIEKGIIDIIFKYLGIDRIPYNTIEKELARIPKGALEKIIKSINNMFFDNDKIIYDNRYLSYLIYYLLVNIYKVWKPLIDLHTRSILKPQMQILDIGTGPGSIPIGVIEFYKTLAETYTNIEFSLNFTFIEKEIEFIKIATDMIDFIKKCLPTNLEISIDSIYNDIVSKDYVNNKLKKYDLIIMSNFLAINEMDNQYNAVSIVNNFYKYLYKDGSLIIINPGDSNNTKILNMTRNKLINEGKFNLYSPCNSIWEEKKTYNCNCFNMTKAYYQVPKIHEYLVREGMNKNLREGVPFSYIVLRIDALRKYKIEQNNQHYIQLKDLKSYDGKNVNISAIIRTVYYKEDNIILTLCDGTLDYKGFQEIVWLNLSNEELELNNIDISLIAGDKITIRKAKVKLNNSAVNLYLSTESKIRIDY